jgi:plastocyanin
MEKRFSQRTSGKLIAAAVASVGLAGLATSQSDASLLVDIRATSLNGGSVADPKNVNVNAGDTVTFNVVVRISGTNATQLTGNFDGANPATDTRNDDSFQSLVGAFNSVGGVKANFQGGANSDQGNGNAAGVFNGSGFQNGNAIDFDSDGDLDLGQVGTDPTNMWVVRAASPQLPTISKGTATGTRLGTSSGSTFAQDFGGGNTGVTGAAVIDATTGEMLVGELTAIVTGGTGNSAVNFVVRANGEAAGLWFEDGISTGKNPTNSPFADGAPVNLFIPEPASIGLMGLASLGLLARRRNRKA